MIGKLRLTDLPCPKLLADILDFPMSAKFIRSSKYMAFLGSTSRLRANLGEGEREKERETAKIEEESERKRRKEGNQKGQKPKVEDTEKKKLAAAEVKGLFPGVQKGDDRRAPVRNRTGAIWTRFPGLCWPVRSARHRDHYCRQLRGSLSPTMLAVVSVVLLLPIPEWAMPQQTRVTDTSDCHHHHKGLRVIPAAKVQTRRVARRV